MDDVLARVKDGTNFGTNFGTTRFTPEI